MVFPRRATFARQRNFVDLADGEVWVEAAALAVRMMTIRRALDCRKEEVYLRPLLVGNKQTNLGSTASDGRGAAASRRSVPLSEVRGDN